MFISVNVEYRGLYHLYIPASAKQRVQGFAYFTFTYTATADMHALSNNRGYAYFTTIDSNSIPAYLTLVVHVYIPSCSQSVQARPLNAVKLRSPPSPAPYAVQ